MIRELNDKMSGVYILESDLAAGCCWIDFSAIMNWGDIHEHLNVTAKIQYLLSGKIAK